MKAVFSRLALSGAVKLANEIVSTNKMFRPVLRCVRIQVDGSKGIISATDLEKGLRIDIEAQSVDSPGVVIIDAKRLLAILSASIDDTILLESASDKLRICGMSSEFELPSLADQEFPGVPEIGPNDKVVEFQASVLMQMIDLTTWCPGGERAGYMAMSGININLEGNGNGKFVATDSRCFAMIDGEYTPPDVTGVATVPVKSLELAKKCMDEPTEKVRLAIRPNDVIIQTERFAVYARVLEGNYPPWKVVMVPDKAIKHKLTVKVGDLLLAVRQAGTMVTEEETRVNFAFTEGRLDLSMDHSTVGRSKIGLPMEGFKGEKLEMLFNPRYWIDALRNLDPKAQIEWCMMASDKPAFVRLPKIFFLVVPLRTVGE